METLSDTFKALSDETRLQIMALLTENQELCVCDLVGTLGETQCRGLTPSALPLPRRAGERSP